MGTIHILPEKVANKIAAGEVIERPASIVKELIENSLDAGATSIEISIKNGGRSLIRISDNGIGMTAEDAELAFRRHATSKISEVEDLHRIDSYGFRGEALASIAAVSRVKLVTRTKTSATGTEIVIEGGSVVSVKESPASPGTSIEVRDLFFNTPARRKFVKSDSTEMGHVLDIVSNIGLSRLDVRFVLKQADKNVLDLLPGETLVSRASKILGMETAKHLLEIETEASGVRLRGLIGKPNLVRANRMGQIFYVNGRWVKAFGLSYALQAGYHGYVMHGQYPVAVLFVDLDPQRVDVNVHPTKQEVKISNESAVKSLIQECVSNRLEKEGNLAPTLKTPLTNNVFQKNFPAESAYAFRESAAQSTLKVAEPEMISLNHAAAQPLAEPILLKKLSITKILGQIHHTFIVAETEEGYILVDQHAAHERVMFESLMKGFQTGSVQRQALLMEEILEVHPRQQEILKNALPMLTQLGFDIEPFGEKTYAIRTYPSVFEKESPVSVLKNFLEEMEDGKSRSSIKNQNEEVCALIACKRQSVKAYDTMTMEAQRVLLERLAQCENPFHCPHGRPTFFKQLFSDLEKQFKRK